MCKKIGRHIPNTVPLDWNFVTMEQLKENQRKRERREQWNLILDAASNNQALMSEVEKIEMLYHLVKKDSNG